MSPPVPEALRTFVRLFNDGEYWESHEALEGPWRESRSAFYHGLILYASAFVHVTRDNAHGIDAQLTKALGALEDLPDVYLGIDVEGVRSHAREVRAEVARRKKNPPDHWKDVLPAPRLTLSEARVRGDEDERA